MIVEMPILSFTFIFWISKICVFFFFFFFLACFLGEVRSLSIHCFVCAFWFWSLGESYNSKD